MDVVAGTGAAPLLVLSLVEGLGHEPTSMLRAERHGGVEYLGWSEDRALLAAIYDAMNTNTIATGQWKKGKAPKLDAWPRPGSDVRDAQTGKKKKVTVKDLFRHFAGRSPVSSQGEDGATYH